LAFSGTGKEIDLGVTFGEFVIAKAERQEDTEAGRPGLRASPTRDVTGSGFDRARFEAVWDDVKRLLAAGADATEVPASAARMSRPARRAIALARTT
jgi:hypothetical protein